MIVARPGVADQRLCVPARQRPVSRLSIRRRNGGLLSATRSGIGWICAAPCGVLASARLVDLRAIPIIPLQSYESDC
jgi:hypothetical protein